MKYLFCVIIALRSPHTCMRMRNAQCVHACTSTYIVQWHSERKNKNIGGERSGKRGGFHTDSRAATHLNCQRGRRHGTCCIPTLSQSSSFFS